MNNQPLHLDSTWFGLIRLSGLQVSNSSRTSASYENSLYTVLPRKEPLHLSTGILVGYLATWYDRYQNKESNKRPKVLSKPVEGLKGAHNRDHKIPFFNIPTFQGNRLNSDTLIKGVDWNLRFTAMARHLESNNYCGNNSWWSFLFASSI